MNIQDNDPNFNTTKFLQTTIALIIAILLTAQAMLVYIVVSDKRKPPHIARLHACDNFELKTPDERARCRPVNYTPKNIIEA